MAHLRISELAARAGVPTSTLRYYERIGLLSPDARGSNGYRRYGDRAVERLAFIGRAKRLGLPLEDVGKLADLWFTGECGPIQEQLHRFLSDRIEAVARRIADDTAFRSQLERMRARLAPGRRPPASGRCGPDCGCDLEPPGAPGAGPPDHPADLSTLLPALSDCSLNGADAADRVARWQRVAGRAQRRDEAGGGLRLCFPTAPGIAAELGELCAEEARCCPGLRFSLEVSPAATVLTVRG
ncbi:MAG TPA: MerR family transcriptional regulator [Actinomycetota bacterium]|nr:MerR family transcriptional regulator [Actinomycetota bacterium]